jgi:periplasmic divalent cation tolerance protein
MADDAGVTGAIVGLVTAPTADAPAIAKELVVRKLAACVNIVPTVRSLYWWDGAVQEDDESLLVVKTTDEMVAPINALLDTIHPYDVFELVTMPISGGSDRYLGWIAGSVSTGT